MTLAQIALIGATTAAGTWLVLDRRIFRVILGLGLLGHAGVLLLISGGRDGVAPVVARMDGSVVADPVPQALSLTAVVIAFGVTALLLGVAVARRGDRPDERPDPGEGLGPDEVPGS